MTDRPEAGPSLDKPWVRFALSAAIAAAIVLGLAALGAGIVAFGLRDPVTIREIQRVAPEASSRSLMPQPDLPPMDLPPIE